MGAVLASLLIQLGSCSLNNLTGEGSAITVKAAEPAEMLSLPIWVDSRLSGGVAVPGSPFSGLHDLFSSMVARGALRLCGRDAVQLHCYKRPWQAGDRGGILSVSRRDAWVKTVAKKTLSWRRHYLWISVSHCCPVEFSLPCMCARGLVIATLRDEPK